MLTWILVAVGGGLGTAIGLLVLRHPSTTRLLLATAVVSAIAGAFSAQLHSARLSLLVGVGVLGSAASMVAVSTAPPHWLGSDAILRSAWIAARKVVVYCAVSVTFALVGYLAVRSGYTLYRKLF